MTLLLWHMCIFINLISGRIFLLLPSSSRVMSNGMVQKISFPAFGIGKVIALSYLSLCISVHVQHRLLPTNTVMVPATFFPQLFCPRVRLMYVWRLILTINILPNLSKQWEARTGCWHNMFLILLPILLKGHWTTSASSPNFFQKSWDFYIIRSVYLCSDCMLNLTCSFNSVTKIYAFFFQ